jgi:CRP-like cAMP-binding protein
LVFQPGDVVPQVYFPTTSVFGVVLVFDDGKQVEASTVGSEGMLGLPAFLGLNFQPFRVLVQVPGEALRLSAAAFSQAAKPSGTLDRLLRRYTLYRLAGAGQLGACNTLHSVEERVARWLLTASDRSGKDKFFLTHEFMSELLGVRRQTISIIARTLQQAGLISYRRGTLRLLDREGLEATSCECYEVLKQLYDRIMWR